MVQVLCPVVVGRDAELAFLETQLASAAAGTSSTVAIVGEAGIGKSRLAREVVARGVELEMLVVVGRATPAGGAGAFRPFVEAVMQAMRGGRRRVLDDPTLVPWLPALAGIVPLHPEIDTATPVSPAVRGEALVQLLTRLAQPQGLVLVLEDLHWADPDTVALVEYLADNLAGQPMLTVVTVRTTEPSEALDLVHRLRGRAATARLELARLDDQAVAQMVRTCSPEVSDDVAKRIEHSADGVPLLVEELLASPGVPTSFAETVRERLARFDADGRQILETAAVLGRHFDWRLLSPATGLPESAVTSVLTAAVERLLLQVEDGAFRFRHALTREAVLADVLPPRQAALAAAALDAVRAGNPSLSGPTRTLAADLATRAGDRAMAAELLAEIGQDDLARGALATAVETLRKAVGLAPGRPEVALRLVEALALAGRVDDAVAASHSFGGETPGERVQLHLRLAQAAVAADRWPMATEHIGAARQAMTDDQRIWEPAISVLEADVALATDDENEGQRHAVAALAAATDPATRCHALEILGRIARWTDSDAARSRFEEALGEADAAGLSLWRMRALHELGTIDMFERAAPERLLEARRRALEIGALSTAAVLGLQLAATSVCRWDAAACLEYGQSSLELAEALGMDEVREKAVLFLAEGSALSGDTDGVEARLTESGALLRPGTDSEGLCWGFRGELALTRGDTEAARRYLDRATAIMADHPRAAPTAFRAMWPLLLAVAGDRRAADALEQARRLGVDVLNLNRGLLGYADAVLAGASDAGRGVALAEEADRRFVNAATWRALARVLASTAARSQGWGDPERWLAQGATLFSELDLPGLVGLCRRGLDTTEPDRWTRAGITARERDVLELVADGLANKEIAQRLRVSARTVEKHVEALLRKTAARSRTQLAVWASDSPT